MASEIYNTANQVQFLGVDATLGNSQPVSSSTIGNIYTITPNQVISVVPEAPKPRLVTLFNIGSLPITVASAQAFFPNGLRVPSCDLIEVVTSSMLWATTPLVVKYLVLSPLAALVTPKAYLGVSIEN